MARKSLLTHENVEPYDYGMAPPHGGVSMQQIGKT